MSKKRPSTEPDYDETTNEGSESFFKSEDNTNKRARLDSLSDTTIQDLPIELIECILVKVVAMVVKDSKLAKSVWKENCDAAIGRLRLVCSQWSNILGTNFFRNELHKALDKMAQKTIGVEILHQMPFKEHVFRVTTLKDDIFMHKFEDEIIIYDRNNMSAVKDVIPLPGMMTMDVAACRVSNCVYVLGIDQNIRRNRFYSVLRITKDEEHQFSISPWISDIREGSLLSAPGNGNLIIMSNQRGQDLPALLSIYSANGFFQRRITLPSGIYSIRFGASALEKPNGNLVIASNIWHTAPFGIGLLLTEISASGSIVRQYQSNLDFFDSAVNFGDIHGRIVISNPPNGIELLDSDLNFLNSNAVQLDGGQCVRGHLLHYDCEKNEMIGFYPHDDKSILTVFRLTEE